MDRILLVTGREAEGRVRGVSAGHQVHVCMVSVAALLSPARILKELRNENLRGVSMILVPGYVSGDISVISKELGVPCYKGTKNVADLPELLKVIDSVELSTKKPADDLLALRDAEQAESEVAAHTSADFHFAIGKKSQVLVGGRRPFRIIAEIPDAPLLSKAELRRRAKYLVKSGAAIVDLGMIAGEDNSKSVSEMVSAVKRSILTPVSIDTLDEREILAANGIADMVLSIGMPNLRLTKRLKCPAVLIPEDSAGRIPEAAPERVAVLETMMQACEENGFKNYIVDPIMRPPISGFSDSLLGYKLFREKYPDVPTMLGVGNVTELLDADSVGVNALLAAFAQDLKIDFLFTTEASNKTRGSVSELKKASKLTFLADVRGQQPKDLGVDLLMLKDKKKIEPIIDSRTRKLKPVRVKESKPDLDSTSYRIYLKGSKIFAVKYSKDKPLRVYEGANAAELSKTICFKEKISPEHAAYLGRELMKAEIALKTGKNYVQDQSVFKRP
ncbi:MAG: dihydropteroate synthase-like protein [Candidatus Altiarchaeota archaeon]